MNKPQSYCTFTPVEVIYNTLKCQKVQMFGVLPKNTSKG